MGRNRWLATLVVLAWAGGCQRSEELVYVPRPEVAALEPKLQEQLQAELQKHCGTPQRPKLLGDDRVSLQHLQHGRDVFQDRCAACHGATGDGNGPAAAYLNPRPRDYRRGIFKFTSTPYGAKPRREDLVRTIRHGARGTSMPAFNLLSDDDLQAVVDYVLVLTHRGELEFLLALTADSDGTVEPEGVTEAIDSIVSQWNSARDQIVLPLTKPIPYSAESVEIGKQAFLSETAGCHKCHGENGRGLTVENQKGFEDSWGFPTRAADLTAGMYHGGGQPLDIYRRIYSGINGTPMPAFSTKLSEQPDTFWHLVHYVQSISGARRAEVVAAESKRTHLPTSPPAQAATP